MSLFSTLRASSRQALKGSWGRAAAATVIPAGFALLLLVLQQVAVMLFVLDPLSRNPTMEPRTFSQVLRSAVQVAPAELVILAVFTLLGILLTAPIRLGGIRWHWQLVHGQSLPVSRIFCFFDSPGLYRRGVWFYISLSLRHILWALLFYAVPAGVLGVSAHLLSGLTAPVDRQTAAIATVGLILSAILLLLATFLYLAFMNRYALAAYLLMEEDGGVGRAVRTSIAYTRGYRFQMLLFSLTFLGWLAMVPFTFGLLHLYVGPYMRTAHTLYGRYIIEKNRFSAEETTREFPAEQPR